MADLGIRGWLEPVELSGDGRLALPAVLRNCLDWGAPKSSFPLLASVKETDQVRLVPLTSAQAELETVRAAIEAAQDGERAALAFAAMATYFRVSLQPDGRLRLPQILTHRMGVGPGATVWVGAFDEVLSLWSSKPWLRAER